MAAVKAADAVFHVDPPHTAKMLRELLYSAFYVTDLRPRSTPWAARTS